MKLLSLHRAVPSTIEGRLLRGEKTLALAQPQPRPCRECGGSFEQHFEFQVVCAQCIDRHRRHQIQEWREEIAIRDRRYFESLGLTGRLRTMTFARFDGACQPEAYDQAVRFAATWPDRKGLVLAGEPGTGKSHLGAAIIHELATIGIDGRFVYLPGFVDDLRLAEDWSKAAAAAFYPLLKVGALVLDDCGRERSTPTLPGLLDRLINERWLAGAPTVLTSNLTVGELYWSGTSGWLSNASTSRFGPDAGVVTLRPGDRRWNPPPPPVAAPPADPAQSCLGCAGCGWVRHAEKKIGDPSRLVKCPACEGRGY